MTPALLRRRDGMTLLEVLLTLAIFLMGSVGIIGLFVAAGVLHAEAVNRRTASMIAEELLADAQARPFREVYARTVLTALANSGDGSITVEATSPAAYATAARFNTYPPPHVEADRDEGPLLLGQEWLWATRDPVVNTQFNVDWKPWGATGGNYDDDRVLQPRTWYYVLDADVDGPDAPGFGTFSPVEVEGDPASEPSVTGGAPASGYIVLDGEWIRYESRNATSFTISTDDDDNDGVPDSRGIGQTQPTAHNAGTPVTVAREHPRYPDFWYAVQYYPTNASGGSSQLIVSVGYGNENRFRVHTFRSIYTPANY